MNYIKKNNINVLKIINKILSNIMEWYIILLIYSSNKNSIVHVGLAHSSEIVEILIKIYKFKKIEDKGINTFENFNMNSTPSACLMIPSYINNMFNRKFGFHF